MARHIKTWVAGAAQHHAEAVAAVRAAAHDAGVADWLGILSPDLHNTADPNAVRVYAPMPSELLVGYIPAKLAPEVRRLLADNAIRDVRVTVPPRGKGLGLVITYVQAGKRQSAEHLAYASRWLSSVADGEQLQRAATWIHDKRAEITKDDKATLRSLYSRAVQRLAGLEGK